MLYTSEYKLVKELFGEDIVCRGSVVGKNREKKVCKNKHLLFDTKKGRVIVKTHTNPLSANREKQAYGILGGRRLTEVPYLHYVDNQFLVTDFIPSDGYDLFQSVRDWARVHSETRDQLFEDVDDFEFVKLVDGVKVDVANLGAYGDRAVNVLGRGLNSPMRALTHGDLYINNTLRRDGTNFYIDFEKFGTSHPVRDLELLLFNHPESAEEIKRVYRKTIDFDYPEIEEDISLHLLLRLSQIIIGLERDVHLPLEFREKYLGRAKAQLSELLV